MSVKQTYQTTFTEVIDYTVQAAGNAFNTFTYPLAANRIVLFITSLWIKGTSGYLLQVHITPTVLNTTHYQWTATVF